MAAVFPPWSNTALRVALSAIAIAVVGSILFLMVFVRSAWRRRQFDALDQPVQFDHRHHTQDDGIECLYCHNTAFRAASAGIPSTDKCMGCHNQIWNQSPLVAPLRESIFSGAPIPWNRVHDVPSFTYFNHSIHVNKGFGCSTCHGRVDQMARVYQVASLTMGWCLDCHTAPERYIRPLAEITNMAWTPGDAHEAEIGPRLVKELGVRRLTHCTACHR
jgi:hypothetical protein